ncbi:hypothetical protein IFM58399_04891 [Aspergillus lentulus]|uniref:Uncharacterized protein n=1 Tax=Aspergillus lentulus TaxID=293939 RepID=A0ABQ1AAT7_ASPLE|nr:uncharacterized protein IFM58399_04891 [Aspergillus lentulus]GFF37431.1 hypothetical protein IFM58399_04891 [Aspergillus lentulus]GFF50629.1 hypothetical protein IFM62136_01582 [Aspergillus lentulus]GFF66085.1 hypothetical protein IFM47457_01259 [Aspergillus lentulus]GFF77705.1 hypothetical protein IFM60648_05026 [Aspergillus lentulus]GFG02147.1 hypothetical protein IFM61392_02145 [Aspergillus lentulus]
MTPPRSASSAWIVTISANPYVSTVCWAEEPGIDICWAPRATPAVHGTGSPESLEQPESPDGPPDRSGNFPIWNISTTRAKKPELISELATVITFDICTIRTHQREAAGLEDDTDEEAEGPMAWPKSAFIEHWRQDIRTAAPMSYADTGCAAGAGESGGGALGGV